MSVLRGDCVEVMAGMDPDSVDAIVCDPPYGLSFMGKEWDALTKVPAHTGPQWGGYGWHGTGTADPGAMYGFHGAWAAAALRVAKPGAYLLAFGGTRTVHRMTCALEDAGWVVRDMLVWAYAQGFPKSRASLKPAWEPIVLCRKPGASRDLRIDEARIGFASEADRDSGVWGNRGQDTAKHVARVGSDGHTLGKGWAGTGSQFNAAGRWPANVILTDPIFDGGWEGVVGGGETTSGKMTRQTHRRDDEADWRFQSGEGYGDSGTYSRFFMLPNETCECGFWLRGHETGSVTHAEWHAENAGPERPDAPRFLLVPKAPTRERVLSDGRRSPHPTQKPEALIRHLVTLVTPPGGLVLDPFLGSGTLGVVCDGLGVRWLGIEREPEYAQWAEDRIADGRPAWLRDTA